VKLRSSPRASSPYGAAFRVSSARAGRSLSDGAGQATSLASHDRLGAWDLERRGAEDVNELGRLLNVQCSVSAGHATPSPGGGDAQGERGGVQQGRAGQESAGEDAQGGEYLSAVGAMEEELRRSNIHISLRSDSSASAVASALRQARDTFGDDLGAVIPPVTEQAVKKLKFAELLPPSLAIATLSARNADHRSAATIALRPVVPAMTVD